MNVNTEDLQNCTNCTHIIMQKTLKSNVVPAKRRIVQSHLNYFYYGEYELHS